MTTQEKLVTVDEFEQFLETSENRDRYFELINGEIIEKVPTEQHGKIAMIIAGEIYIYLKQNPIGRALIEVRYKLPGDQYNSRQPDLSFEKTTERPVVTKGAVLHMPTLAIEVQSPSDSIRSMRERADYYIKNGAQAVWLIFPTQHIVETYSAEAQQILAIDDILDGSELLPGFSLSVKTIFGL